LQTPSITKAGRVFFIKYKIEKEIQIKEINTIMAHDQQVIKWVQVQQQRMNVT